MMKAQDVFNLNVIERKRNIALVSDGNERFLVRVDGLDELIEPVDCDSEAGCTAYDEWCNKWSVK